MLGHKGYKYGYNTQTVSGDYDLTFGSWDADFVGHGTHVAGIIGAWQA